MIQTHDLDFFFITMRLSGTRFWMKQFREVNARYRMIHVKEVYLPLVFEALTSPLPIITCHRKLEDIQDSYLRRNWDPTIADREYTTWKELIEPNAAIVLDLEHPEDKYYFGDFTLVVNDWTPVSD